MNTPKPVIIVADDDSDDRMLIKEALEATGFAGWIRFAADGQELLEILADGNLCPSLIILDLNMPRMDGREILKELKQDNERRSIPILIHSTCNSTEEIENCYNHGVNSYLVKPASFEELKENLREVIQYWFETAQLPEKKSCSR